MTPTRSSLLAALCVLAVTELALGGLASTPASAKDKTSGKYEEHYETLPPDADPGADPNADPGADANAASDVAPAPDGALEPDAAPVRRPVRQERRSRPPENDAGRSDKHAVPRDAQPQPERARTHDSEDRDERRHQRVRAADPAAGFDRDDADRGEGRGEDPDSEIADVAYFYEALDEGGRWITHARYGEVWQPNVDEGWRPYTLGRWAFSADYGWTWVSDEPFGWAVYHYGRWTFDGGDGWMWVPGTEWGPAWVAWRNSDDVIGWAPLPPSARFTGGRMSVDASAMEGDRFEHGWVFVRPRYFARPEMRRYVRPPSWNADLVVRTTPRLGYERGSRGVMNRGLAPEEVERLASRPVPRVKIAPVDEPGLRRPDRFDDWRGKRAGEVKIYRPGHKRTVETMKKSRRANSDNGERDRSRDNGERDRSRDNGERDRSHDKSERRNAAAPALPPGVNPGGRKPAGAAANPAPSNAPGKGVPAFAPRPPTSAASEDAPASAPPKNSAPSSAKSYGEPYEKNYGEARDTPSTTPSAARSSGTDTSSTGKSGDTPPDSRTGERRRSEVTRSQSVRSESTANSKTSDGGATTGTIEQPATKGKKRWDGSGTSGAPSPSGASPEVDQQ